MRPIPVSLAVEDDLSESVLKAILKQVDRGYAVGPVHSRGGFGYLKKNALRFNRAAERGVFLMLTDLDKAECPKSLIDSWLGRETPIHGNFLLRVATREVEAWLLADRVNLANFLRVAPTLFPRHNPDELQDPKQTLVDIARKSRSREVRERLLPRPGSTAKQGPDYNSCLDEFVSGQWNIATARVQSDSLERAIRRFEQFEPAGW